ncbi:MAG: zinc metalloprotease HtpX [Actinomycetota bacterium]
MTTRRFPKDPGLQARMLLVMFLLGLLYVVFIAVMSNYVGGSMAMILAAGLLFSQYYFSDKIALFAMRAKEVSPAEAPELHAIVDRLCALSDTPKPRVAMADTDMPNAFATGRSPRHAVVCATTGLMRRLDETELEGVIAHELAHVAHRDVAVMTIASFLGMAAGLITRFAMYGGMGHGGRDRENNNSAALALLVSVLVYCVSFVLTRALSRYRELSADRSGAFLTGAPSALASALQKISGTMGQIPTRDLRAAEPMNAFFFAPAAAPGMSLATLFSTHPPLERRLAQLARIEAELGRGA